MPVCVGSDCRDLSIDRRTDEEQEADEDHEDQQLLPPVEEIGPEEDLVVKVEEPYPPARDGRYFRSGRRDHESSVSKSTLVLLKSWTEESATSREAMHTLTARVCREASSSRRASAAAVAPPASGPFSRQNDCLYPLSR